MERTIARVNKREIDCVVFHFDEEEIILTGMVRQWFPRYKVSKDAKNHVTVSWKEQTMDLLRYSETTLEVCLKDKPRREINDILRQIFLHPDKIHICPCGEVSPWIRETLRFLGATYSNEPSHPK